ncbi:hypothetical protein B4113_0610 [Geobacillus sp. B4113_201601]|nr:hypothetical protein B4113_0610 [Geobacillus sp. B4113_201601]
MAGRSLFDAQSKFLHNRRLSGACLAKLVCPRFLFFALMLKSV